VLGLEHGLLRRGHLLRRAVVGGIGGHAAEVGQRAEGGVRGDLPAVVPEESWGGGEVSARGRARRGVGGETRVRARRDDEASVRTARSVRDTPPSGEADRRTPNRRDARAVGRGRPRRRTGARA
jgi:hypothetical protein